MNLCLQWPEYHGVIVAKNITLKNVEVNMSRETEVLLLTLDFYAHTRSGTPAAEEAKALAAKIRNEGTK